MNALGQVPGGDYIDYYADTKRQEFMDWHAWVSAWETRAIPHTVLTKSQRRKEEVGEKS